jgi:NADH:ubiquinone oxidoreductase subunit H
MPASPLDKNKRKNLNKVILIMDSTIIIEKSVIILVVLRLQCLWLCILRLQRGKRLGFKIVSVLTEGKWTLQPLADGLKLFRKRFEPNTPNKFLFYTGPAIAMSTALMTSAFHGDKFHLLSILYCKFQILIMLYCTFCHPINRGLHHDWWMGI